MLARTLSQLRLILTAFFLLFAAMLPRTTVLAADSETLVDRIVAIVDGYPVLYSEVQNKVQNGPLVVVSEYPATEAATAYEKALQDAVNFELIMQKARELEIDVRDEEVESEIQGFLQNRGLAKDGLLEFLAQNGQEYEDYKADFRDQMVLRRFQGRVISPLVKVTDKDVETYYLKKAGASNDMVKLTLRQILIKADPGAANDVLEAKRKLAEEVHQKLVGGMGFEDAVKIYSDDENARANGGLMAGIRLKDLAGSIRTEVEGLEESQFTVPLRTSLGFHIFYLQDKAFSSSAEFENQKKQLEFELRNVELVNQTRRWLSEQRQKSKVEILK